MELVELPVPQPKPTEAVVKLAASGVNFIDVYVREGRHKAQTPFILGQEGAGTVIAAGKEVNSVKAGDRVAWTNVLGSYAEYAAVPADRLVPVPARVTDRQAAAASLSGPPEAGRNLYGTGRADAVRTALGCFAQALACHSGRGCHATSLFRLCSALSFG
jgi:NADPH:quinone reductase-like Zn-dependent oxidoreductase